MHRNEDGQDVTEAPVDLIVASTRRMIRRTCGLVVVRWLITGGLLWLFLPQFPFLVWSLIFIVPLATWNLWMAWKTWQDVDAKVEEIRRITLDIPTTDDK